MWPASVLWLEPAGNLRASLNHYGYIRQTVGSMPGSGRARSFGSHCFDCAGAISIPASSGVIEEGAAGL